MLALIEHASRAFCVSLVVAFSRVSNSFSSSVQRSLVPAGSLGNLQFNQKKNKKISDESQPENTIIVSASVASLGVTSSLAKKDTFSDKLKNIDNSGPNQFGATDCVLVERDCNFNSDEKAVMVKLKSGTHEKLMLPWKDVLILKLVGGNHTYR